MNQGSGNHLEIGALPDLRVINLRELAFHEEPDAHRLAMMVSRLRTEGMLKNPPIVAAGPDGSRFILLDGANRVSALLTWGFEHVLVQVVAMDDSLLELQTWHHAIETLGHEFFSQKLEQLPAGDTVIEETDETGGEDDPGTVCRLTFADGRTLRVTRDGGLPGQVRTLRAVTGHYLKTTFFDRVSYTSREHLAQNYPDFATLIRFRRFTMAEVIELVHTGERIPAGVTRVFLPKRALGLNISLDFLRSIAGVEEKNRRLQALIAARVREKSIRFYREPTFVFDE